jgi:hypothetical protein
MSQTEAQTTLEQFQNKNPTRFENEITGLSRPAQMYLVSNSHKITKEKIPDPQERWNWSDISHWDQSILHKLKEESLIEQRKDGSWKTTKILIKKLAKYENTNPHKLIRPIPKQDS